MHKSLRVTDLQSKPYSDVYELQRLLVAKRRAQEDEPDTLLLVEHPEVYTYGRKSKDEDVTTLPEPHFFVERGGEATYHNLGQLVGYPILRLDEGERDLHLYLRRLEDTLIDAVALFGLRAVHVEGATGVWIEGKNRKIASIGVAVSSWVTYHGFALNVSNDLSGFSRIHPCGFSAEIMTSMETELGRKIPMHEVKSAVVKAFSQRFLRFALPVFL